MLDPGEWSFGHFRIRGGPQCLTTFDDRLLLAGDYKGKIKFNKDGSVDTTLKLTVKNPSKFPIEIEAVPTSKDSRWSVGPDHQHAKIAPGKSVDLSFKIKRPAGKLDKTLRPLVVQLGIDMLAGKRRYPIPVKRVSVPGSLRVDPE